MEKKKLKIICLENHIFFKKVLNKKLKIYNYIKKYFNCYFNVYIFIGKLLIYHTTFYSCIKSALSELINLKYLDFLLKSAFFKRKLRI